VWPFGTSNSSRIVTIQSLWAAAADEGLQATIVKGNSKQSKVCLPKENLCGNKPLQEKNKRAAFRKRKGRDIEKKIWISVGISINHQVLYKVHLTHNNKT